VIGNSVATAVVSKWEGLLRPEDTENPDLERSLTGELPHRDAARPPAG
jgi:hypothetical protein